MCRLIFWTVKIRLWSQDISYSFIHFLKNRVKLEVLVDASSKKGSIIAKTRHWRETSFPGSRYEKRISFHISGTPGRHQWLQSGTDGLSLQVPTWPSLRNATMGVTCRTVTGTVIFLTILIMMFEIELWSLPLELDKGCWVTLHELWLRPLVHIRITSSQVLHEYVCIEEQWWKLNIYLNLQDLASIKQKIGQIYR